MPAAAATTPRQWAAGWAAVRDQVQSRVKAAALGERVVIAPRARAGAAAWPAGVGTRRARAAASHLSRSTTPFSTRRRRVDSRSRARRRPPLTRPVSEREARRSGPNLRHEHVSFVTRRALFVTKV